MKFKKCLFCLVFVVMCVFGFSLFSVKTNAITAVPTNQYLGSVDIPFYLADSNGNFANGEPMKFYIDYGIVSSPLSNFYIGTVNSNPSYLFDTMLPITYFYNYDSNIISSFFFKSFSFTSGWSVDSSFALELYGSITFNNNTYVLSIDDVNEVSIIFGYSLPSNYQVANDVFEADFILKDDIEFVENENAITFYSGDYIYTFLDSYYFTLDILEVYGDIDLLNNFYQLNYSYSSALNYYYEINSPFLNGLFNSLFNWYSNFLNISFNSEGYDLIFSINNLFMTCSYYNYSGFLNLVVFDNTYYMPSVYGDYPFTYFPYYLQKAILDYEIVGTTSEQLKEQEIYYNQVIKDVEEEFYNKGFNVGNSQGFNSGYNSGYNVGYSNGVQDGSDGEFTLRSLLGTIFTFPLSIMTEGLNVELWGINVGGLLMFFFAIAIVLIIIRLIFKFFGK